MANCIITYKNHTFESEEDLDIFLRRYQVSKPLKKGRLMTTFATEVETNPVLRAEKIIKEFTGKSTEKTLNAEAIGKTLRLKKKNPGDKVLIPELAPSRTKEDITSIAITTLEKLWFNELYKDKEIPESAKPTKFEHPTDATDAGDDFDKILTYKFAGVTIPRDLKARKFFKKLNNDPNDPIVKKLCADAEELVLELKRIYGGPSGKCKFITFNEIIDGDGKTIDQGRSSIGALKLGEKLRLFLDSLGYSFFKEAQDDLLSINCKPDLLIIDQNGDVHVYDFKTSYKKFGTWGSEGPEYVSKSMRNAYEFQIFAEGAMLAQMGLNVKSHNVIAGRTIWDGAGTEEDPRKFKAIELEKIPIKLTPSGIMSMMTKSFFPHAKPMENADAITTTNEKFKYIVPQGTFKSEAEEIKLEAKEKWNEARVLSDSETDRVYKRQGKTHKIYLNGPTQEWYYFTKDEAHREEFNQRIAKYEEELNDWRAGELTNLANALVSAQAADTNAESGYEYVREFLEGIHKRSVEVAVTLRRYIVNKWTFMPDETLNQQGFFLFQKDGVCDIIYIHTGGSSLNRMVNLTHNKTVLGNFRKSKSLPSLDNRFILPSSIGHLFMMKAMLYISENKEFFKDFKINNILVTALHPSSDKIPRFTSYSGETMVRNWRLLLNCASAEFPNIFDPNKNDVFPEQFTSPTERAILNAQEILNADNVVFPRYVPKLFNSAFIENYQGDEAMFLQDLIKDLKRTVPWLNDLSNKEYTRPEVRALHQLETALAYVCNKWEIIITEDAATHSISPAAESTSPNDRVLNEIGATYFASMRNMMQNIVTSWEVKARKIHETSISGQEFQFYKNWFEKNDDGSVSKDFRIKDFSDSYWKNHPEEKEAAEFFLDMLAVFKADARTEGGRVVTVDAIKSDDNLYYQVPLIKTNFFKGVANGSGWDMIKSSVKDLGNIVSEVYKTGLTGEVTKMSEDYASKLNKLDVDVLPNPSILSTEDRLKVTEKHDAGYFEMDLDKVMMFCALYHARRAVSRFYLPLFAFMKTGLILENQYGQHILDKTSDFVNDYIKSNVFMQDLENNNFVQAVKALVGKAKQFTSLLTLAFSTASTAVELGSGTIRTILETHGPIMNEDVSPEEYTKQLAYMMAHPEEAVKEDGFNTDLNRRLGMVNASPQELANTSPNKGFMNWDGDVWYIAQTVPDWLQRIAIARAALQKRGSLDAFEQTEDKKWVYHMEKDKRWEILFKYKDASEVPAGEYAEWSAKRDEYIESLRRWKARRDTGDDTYQNLTFPKPNESLGDHLPYPLDPVEQNGIKTISEILYGNYDETTKSLIQKKFLGALFFQFKTYALARMWEWVKPDGSINVIHRQQMTDSATGKPIWYVLASPEEAERNGGNPWKQVVEDSPEFEEAVRNKIPMKPWKESLGNPMEGRIESSWSFISNVLNWSDGDYHEVLEDPVARANLIFSLHDLLWMSILAMLVKALFGDEVVDNLTEQEWYTRWAYSVMLRITREGPIWQTASSIIGDGLPPSVSILKRYVDTAASVINGNTNLAYAFASSVGATRELSNIWKEN